MSGHIVELKTNVTTFIALVCLTILTVLTAKFVDLGDGNLILAMAIATVKASIVFLWFMHLKYDGLVNRVAAFCGIFFLALLIGISYLDLFFR